jgi:hypothetical protein
MLDTQKLKSFALSHPELVSIKPSSRYPGLSVVKYKPTVFFKNLWTPELEEMRGLVVDQDWNVVVLPFKKIYNRMERGFDIPRDEIVVAMRKVNGFMAAVTNTKDHGLLVSTTGSLDSDYVDFAKEIIGPEKPEFDELPYGVTFLYEVVHPSDPHVVPELKGAYLLGARLHETGALLLPESGHYGINVPEMITCHYGDLVAHLPRVTHEGYVVYGSGNTERALKLKSPHYLVTKFFGRKTEQKLQDILTRDQAPNLEEEFFPLFYYLKRNKDAFLSMNEQERFNYVKDFLNGPEACNYTQGN